MHLSPCGIDCEQCDYFKDCGGCNTIEGKPFYLKDFDVEVCPMYDCSVNKMGYKTCGECSALPCQIFYDWKDPSMTDNEHIDSVIERTLVLESLNR